MIINGFGGNNGVMDANRLGTLVSSSTTTYAQTQAVSATSWPGVCQASSGAYGSSVLYSFSNTTINVADLLTKYTCLKLNPVVTSMTTPAIQMSMSVTTNSGGSISQSFIWPFRYVFGCNTGNSDYWNSTLYYRDCNYSYTFGSTGTKNITVPAANFGSLASDSSFQHGYITINRIGLGFAPGYWVLNYHTITSTSSTLSVSITNTPAFGTLNMAYGLMLNNHVDNVNRSIPSKPTSLTVTGGSITIRWDIYGY